VAKPLILRWSAADELRLGRRGWDITSSGHPGAWGTPENQLSISSRLPLCVS
jgi:hypothetical protein